MKFSETVAQVIALATAIRYYWDTELPKRHPNYPVVSPAEDSGPPPPEEKQLRNLLAGLPDNDISKLALLMYLGRGDFGPDDLAVQYETLQQRFAKPGWVIAQLMGKAPLADYLADGLAELKRGDIDVDHLALASVRSSS